MRFMHLADIHLGYQQYGSTDRFDDFSRVLLYLVEQAIEREVDFLDGLGYLHLLNPRFENGRAVLEPYSEVGGANVNLEGVRIYGLKYYGASTGKVFGLFADALTEMDHSDLDFVILMSHAGMEGQLPHYSGTLTHNDLAPLRGHIDYLALGHIHKPYTVDGWIYNPGSPETWSMDEIAWPKRGCYLVEVEPGKNPGHRAELLSPPRRPFHRFRLEVDALTEPNAVYDAVRRLLEREEKGIDRDPAPVVELTLSGVLPFNRFDLDLDDIKSLLEEA
jgi:DNA repair exonuclease SbcCD nuclease subunit